MLRVIGGIMIVSGCLGLGMWYRLQFVQRLQNLRILLGILELLTSEIRYGKSTLPECCKHVGERQQEPYRSSLLSVYESMEENRGECFESVFCSRMEECFRQLPLQKEDVEHFLGFVRGNGFADGQMQLKNIESSKELLKLTVGGLEKENAEKCRMAVGLGAMSGLLLIIILL